MKSPKDMSANPIKIERYLKQGRQPHDWRTLFLNDIVRSKRASRLRQARLPIEEKMAAVVRLQELAYEMAKRTGQPPRRPWGKAP